MVIERNYIPYKNVSCAACTYYCREDQSCLKTGILPKIDGWQSWRKCNWFDLDSDYMDDIHMEKVREVKGHSFFERDREVSATQLEAEKKERLAKQRARLIHQEDKEEKVDLFFEKIKKFA